MKELTNQLIEEHGTRNPKEIAENLGIHILYEPLGKINGYFNIVLGISFIHINNSLPEPKQLFTLAHELGHAILHKDTNALFLLNHTYQSVKPIEDEANKFASHLIFCDDFVEEHKHISAYDLSEIYQVDVKIIEYRLNYT